MTLTAALIWFALISLILVGTEIMYTYATKGIPYGFSANRATPELTPFGARLKRTYQNQVESASYILPALIGASLAGLSGQGVELAALLIVIGRASFAALYLTGISFVRVPAFVLGTFSSAYLIYVALTSGAL